MDERHLQEGQADKRQAEVVREAHDTRARILRALDDVDRELQRARREVESLPPVSPQRKWWEVWR